MVTPERFAQGMTFAEYVAYTGTPENLAREAGWWQGMQRKDLSGLLREWYHRVRLTDTQIAAIRWLAAQPDGPAKILVISEEWVLRLPARRADARAIGGGGRPGAADLRS